ncbi:CbtA family protein [Nocardioides litoris]|uniref:CbtA family protein n=1 Tax=Nocardioides litoris TaxID=1926648 RepID=UPI00111EAAA3|nr:CbtA family protein [Nocardioides litoris]
MTARNVLVRGLLVGLLAGLAAFLVAHEVGEPHVETAIALEEAASAADPAAEAADEPEEEVTEVSRPVQRTWGLLTGTVAIGVVLGGFVALLSAAAIGRLGRLTAVQTTGLVAAIGFVAYSLVPFLKYPATPPAVGSGDTIGSRTSDYFLLVLVSVVAALAAVQLARALADRFGGLRASMAGVAAYVVVAGVAAALLPTVNEVGAFPADTLWSFRVSSLLTLTTLWAVIGAGLVLSVDRLARAERAVAERRALAASL